MCLARGLFLCLLLFLCVLSVSVSHLRSSVETTEQPRKLTDACAGLVGVTGRSALTHTHVLKHIPSFSDSARCCRPNNCTVPTKLRPLPLCDIKEQCLMGCSGSAGLRNNYCTQHNTQTRTPGTILSHLCGPVTWSASENAHNCQLLRSHWSKVSSLMPYYVHITASLS